MILKGWQQNWKTVGEHALYFAEIWFFIGTAFGLTNKSFPSSWLAMATTITLGCAGCMFLTWIIIRGIDQFKRKNQSKEIHSIIP